MINFNLIIKYYKALFKVFKVKSEKYDFYTTNLIK